jgi:hypothetical protein
LFVEVDEILNLACPACSRRNRQGELAWSSETKKTATTATIGMLIAQFVGVTKSSNFALRLTR